ncbi:uncharacterized protein N7483_005702 [Penicillium malachiteum]|uniref:uncharacterized protein n=1 Tax=Penicillium malachiteum TaxID=1324776 RepID=UPI002548E1B0|nr:uncharacterized protein N7483_005702 [Penicillium malachiteum]KAJ5731194.1 hypothetical protein N7483_005702 [Penicillium malachiteum]
MDPTLTVNSKALSPWNTAEVGYFYPENDALKHIETGDNHIIIFHNAEAFVSHLHGIAIFKTEAVVRANVHSCLREVALEWYITELTHPEREELRNLPLDQGWFMQILLRFNPSPKIARFRYETANFYNRNPFRMAYNLIRDGHAAGVHDLTEHLCQIWRCLDTSVSNVCFLEQTGYKGLLIQPGPGDVLSIFHRELNHRIMDFAIKMQDYDAVVEDDPYLFREWCRDPLRWSNVVANYSYKINSFQSTATQNAGFRLEI